jgi:hypothetical protein
MVIMSTWIQEIVVGAAALVAASYVVQRIVAAVRPQTPDAGCESCGLQRD